MALSAKIHVVTPLIRRKFFGINFCFKLENLQPSGSFKDRGIGNMISELMKTKNVEKIICSSGGNAGHSVATVAQRVGLPAEVYVPTSTKALMIDKLKQTGTE